MLGPSDPLPPEFHALWAEERLTAQHQRRHLKHLCRGIGRVLEIGSDQGVMLALLKEHGQEAYGIDLDPAKVAAVQARGLEAYQADALTHLSQLPCDSLGGILLAHVIEHLPPAKAIALLREAARTMKPGARLVIVTPNPRDLRTTERFWYDPTHVRPYPGPLLVRLLGMCGLNIVEVAEDREPAANLFVRMAKLVARAWFLGMMFRGDLIVVAERPA
jgi:SAM-dependent methyltransferase